MLVCMTLRARLLILPLAPALALSLAGCPTDPVPEDDAGPQPDGLVVDAALGDVPTYTGDVRPILAEHCTGCHVTGGIAPFALDSYALAQSFGARIVETTQARIMPPFLADNSGSCNTYVDARWLEDAELATLAAWVAGGMPEGDPAIPPPDPMHPPTLDPSEIATTLDIGEDWTPPTTSPDSYRCFVVDMSAVGDQFVTGYEVVPGDPRVVHHVILYEPQDADAAAAVMTADAEDPAQGYPCNGGVGASAYPVALWAPGSGAQHFPTGTGVRVGNWPAVIQIHYNITGSGTHADRTRIHLRAGTGVRPAVITSIADPAALRLAPRMSSVSQVIDQPVPTDARVYGIFPHMHQRGVSVRAELLRGGAGAPECMTELPRWDFNWQLGYYYENPIDVARGDSVRVTCTFDTTTESDVVTWGEGTADEMCIVFFYVTGAP
jgi:hypothetical protein